MGVLDRCMLCDSRWEHISDTIFGRPDQRCSTGRYSIGPWAGVPAGPGSRQCPLSNEVLL